MFGNIEEKLRTTPYEHLDAVDYNMDMAQLNLSKIYLRRQKKKGDLTNKLDKHHIKKLHAKIGKQRLELYMQELLKENPFNEKAKCYKCETDCRCE